MTSEWIPVTEQMPPIGELVLFVAVVDGYVHEPRLAMYTDELNLAGCHVMTDDGRLLASKPWWPCTHWMRIPGTDELISQR